MQMFEQRLTIRDFWWRKNELQKIRIPQRVPFKKCMQIFKCPQSLFIYQPMIEMLSNRIGEFDEVMSDPLKITVSNVRIYP